MGETWTTEYPTKPGYYWLKNYHLSDWRDSWLVPGPVIVCVMPNHRNAPEFRLVFDFTGDDRGYGERDIVSAEWLGPIEPPVDNWHRHGVVPVTLCAWCNKPGELLHWSAQGADGFYHGAVVCRECYERKLGPERNKL